MKHWEQDRNRLCQVETDLNNQVISLKKHITDLNQQHDNKLVEISNEKEQFQQKIKDFNQKIIEYEFKIKKKAKRNENYQQLLDELKIKKENEKVQEIQKLNLLNQKLTQEKEQIINDNQLIHNNLQDQITNLKTQLESETLKVLSLNEQRVTLQENQTRLQQTLEQQKQVLEEKCIEQDRYQNSIMSMSQKLNEIFVENQINKEKLTQQIIVKDKEIELLLKLKRQLEQEQQENQFYKQKYEEQKQINTEKADYIEALNKKLNEQQLILDKKVQQFEEQTAEIKLLQNQTIEQDEIISNYKKQKEQFDQQTGMLIKKQDDQQIIMRDQIEIIGRLQEELINKEVNIKKLMEEQQGLQHQLMLAQEIQNSLSYIISNQNLSSRIFEQPLHKRESDVNAKQELKNLQNEFEEFKKGSNQKISELQSALDQIQKFLIKLFKLFGN